MLDAQLLPVLAIFFCLWSMQREWNPRCCKTIGTVAKEGEYGTYSVPKFDGSDEHIG